MENINTEKTPGFVFETIRLLHFCLDQVSVETQSTDCELWSELFTAAQRGEQVGGLRSYRVGTSDFVSGITTLSLESHSTCLQ